MTYQVITGTLKARTAVHVGSGAGGDLTDALLRRDATGRPVIPGTAIAGALRTLATRLAPRLELKNNKVCAALTGSDDPCDCAVCHLFGDVNPSDAEDAKSEASRILVFNARLKGDEPKPFIRDGVGIDRTTGAAARAGRVKFDLEVLPTDTKFEFRLELRDAYEDDKRLLAAVLAEWTAGRAWLGGNVARGLGGFKLGDVEYRMLNLDTADNLLTFLKEDEPWQEAKPQSNWLQNHVKTVRIKPPSADDDFPVARCWVIITGTLQARGPLLTNDATISGQTGFDHAPLLAQMGDWERPVLTGSGLRGVLRSHAERIARTLATHNASGEKAFLHTCPACSPVESQSDKPLASCDKLLKDAKLPTDREVSDDHLCLACRLFGSTRRGSRLLVEDAPYQPTEPQPKPVLKMLDFLAIDRFTGGGAEGAKFDALALWRPAFKLRLHLENPTPWELGWLALVLRDLQEGWLTVGFGAAKGFGRVELHNWIAQLGYLHADDWPDIAQLRKGQPDGVYTRVDLRGDSEDWLRLAGSWVQVFCRKIEKFERSKQIQLKKDSYFDGLIEKLYPLEVA